MSSSLPESEDKEFRSFWRAGNYETVFSRPLPSLQGHFEHARVHPRFLHSNATSHKWAFGAIAELLDNAVDEICNGATYVKVDRIYNRKDSSPALLFQDDGGGMDPVGLRKCVSLGYSSKKANTSIGQYGNGFKTSTMRLGADVIVFTCKSCGKCATRSIGLLSYTFLRRTGQDDIVVPMVDFEVSDHGPEPFFYSSEADWHNDMKILIDWSPFSSQDDLMSQFEDIGPHGTKVIVYNLWLDDDGHLELNFDQDDEDIRLSEEGSIVASKKDNEKMFKSHISFSYRFSLRAYASILYLRIFHGFQIILRGKPVQQLRIVDLLKFSEVLTYKPQVGISSKEVSVEASIGFVKEAPVFRTHGVNIYHKNRLIKPFFSVIATGSGQGLGVVGVVEANFIEPAHDKQDFERTALFIRLETRLKQMVNEYWKRKCHLIGLLGPGAYRSGPTKEHSVSKTRTEDSECLQQGSPAGEAHGDLTSDSWVQFEQDEAPTRQRSIHSRDRSASPDVQELTQQSTVCNGEFMDVPSSVVADKICEENIKLFMRCEDCRQKEADLQQMVEELHEEIEEKRRKCAQLAKQIEIQKKQMTSHP